MKSYKRLIACLTPSCEQYNISVWQDAHVQQLPRADGALNGSVEVYRYDDLKCGWCDSNMHVIPS